MPRSDPIRPTDDGARALARGLIDGAATAALAVLTPEGAPFVTRIAMGCAPDGVPMSLISTLAAHTAALKADPACSLLLDAPGGKGDPLTHPRLTLQARAAFADKTPALRAHWLAGHPKAKLYVDFTDFGFVRFQVSAGFLNGGFGQAFRLTPGDLELD